MNKLKAILFDYDGTLRDSRSIIYTALERALAAITDGPLPSREEMAPYVHHHSFVHETFAPDVSFERFDKEYWQAFDDLRPTLSLDEGAAELLARLDTEYILGLVTAEVDPLKDLARFNIEQYFDLIVTGREVTKPKPNPEGLNLALERLGLTPSEAAYIGDTTADIYASRAAHLRASIGITTGFSNRKHLETANPTFVVDTLAEVPAVIQQIEAV